MFEYVYLARPDSVIGGRLLYEARMAMGRQLAIEHPAEADLVIPVPDSAIPAAIGFAEQSGLPYREGLIKNRYVGRTFIQPLQRSREAASGNTRTSARTPSTRPYSMRCLIRIRFEDAALGAGSAATGRRPLAV